MKMLGKLLVFSLLCAFSAVSLPTEYAAAAYKRTSDQAESTVTSDEQKLLDATVNIYCRVKSGNKTVSTTGTGVVIDSRGVILTNAHVAQYFLLTGTSTKLKADCSIRTGSPAKASYTAKLLYLSSGWITDSDPDEFTKKKPKGTGANDFALLYITGTTRKKGILPQSFSTMPLDMAVPAREGDRVLVAGYPAGELKFKDIQRNLKARVASSTVANIYALDRGNSDVVALTPLKIVSSGISGGPITRDEKLIAIASTMSVGNKKEGNSLRGVSIPYIDRTVRAETGLPLQGVYAGNLEIQSELLMNISLSDRLLKLIEKRIRLIR